MSKHIIPNPKIIIGISDQGRIPVVVDVVEYNKLMALPNAGILTGRDKYEVKNERH